MASPVAALVACSSEGRHLARTLASLERQSLPALETVVLVPCRGPAAARVRELLGGRPGLQAAAWDAERPGVGWNAGLRASGGEHVICLEEGDALDPGYVERARARLHADPGCVFVTAWTLRETATGESCGVGLVGEDLATLAATPWAIPRASLFTRRAWEAAGGFDETLPDLEDYDFWLRLLEQGGRGAVIAEALIHESWRADSRYRRSIDQGAYLATLAAVLARRRLPAGADVAALLLNPERLRTEHRMLVERRDALSAELTALGEESARLGEELRAAGREGIDWGDLRRVTPVSANWGYERGRPIDRHYIEQFLELHAADIQGRVLEVQESDYTRRFGGAAVRQSEVVDADPGNPRATVVADLRRAAGIPSDTYDCFILTQTLHVIDDMPAVLAECARILKPGGVLLATLPCTSRVCLEYGRDGDFWRLTEAGVRRLFSAAFPPDCLEVRSHGNVLVATAFLYGLASHEVTAAEFDAFDPYHPLLVTVRAVKPTKAPQPVRAAGDASGTDAGLILLYHRVAERTRDVHGLCVPPAQFREHLEYLRRHHQPLSLEAMAAAVRAGRVPAGAVAVTFDDGYVDNLLTASPLLCELGVPATFFVTGAGWDAPHEFWWDALERFLLGPGPLPPALELEVRGERLSLGTAGDADREAAHGALHQRIVRCGREERDRVMEELAAWSGRPRSAPPADRPLLAEEIRLLSRLPGHGVGAHTMHHLALAGMPREVQEREVADHKRRLEALVGTPVSAFAYPFGDHSPETVEVVRQASFHSAVTCVEAAVRGGADALALPRVEVKACTVEGLARLLRQALGEGPSRADP